MKNSLRRLLGIISLIVPFLLVHDALAERQDTQEFQVEGVMHITPRTFSPSDCRVQINHRGSQWCIREIVKTKFRDPGALPRDIPAPNAVVHTLSSDGTNIYFLEHFETNSVDKASFEHPNPITRGVADIYAPGFPNRLLEPCMVILFYAYLSSPYLDSVTNNLLDPIKFAPDFLMHGDEQVHAAYKRASDALGLPTQIVFSYYGNAQPSNAVFEASNFTNLFGVQLPMRVVARSYAMDGQVGMNYEFEALHLSGKCAVVSFRPDLTRGAMVHDYRFSHGPTEVPSINHGLMTNWPTEAESKLTSGYKVIQNWHRLKGEK